MLYERFVVVFVFVVAAVVVVVVVVVIGLCPGGLGRLSRDRATAKTAGHAVVVRLQTRPGRL